MGSMPPAMNTSASDLAGGRRLPMSFISSRPASTPAPSYHVPLLVGPPPPQGVSNTFMRGSSVNGRPDMPPVLPFPAGVRPLGPTAIETHPFCQAGMSLMFPSSRMPPPPQHMLRSPRHPGSMSGYVPKTTAFCGSTIVGGSTAWPSLTADVAKCKTPGGNVVLTSGCTNTTNAVPTTMSVAMDSSKPRQPVVYRPTVNMIASNMPPPRPNSLQVAPPESGVAYELNGVSASEPSVATPTSTPYVMYHTASSSCSNNTVVYSSPGFNSAMPYPPVSLTPTQSPAPSGGGSPGPSTTLPPPANGGDNGVSPCPCSSCTKQAPTVTSGYQYSYPLMWPPHGAIYQAPAGAYHMGFMPPSTSNGLINPSMSYRQVHPSYNLNGYSPEVIYANQANYASVLPPGGSVGNQGSGPQPAFVNCVQYVAGGRPAMPSQQYMMAAAGSSKTNKKAVCCCNCGSSGHLSSNCKETTMDSISHIGEYLLLLYLTLVSIHCLS